MNLTPSQEKRLRAEQACGNYGVGFVEDQIHDEQLKAFIADAWECLLAGNDKHCVATEDAVLAAQEALGIVVLRSYRTKDEEAIAIYDARQFLQDAYEGEWRMVFDRKGGRV